MLTEMSVTHARTQCLAVLNVQAVQYALAVILVLILYRTNAGVIRTSIHWLSVQLALY